MPDYVILTAARNEAAYIGKTLESVEAQSRRPLCWVIVSDGSTDQTDALVAEHARRHPFIRLVTAAPDGARNFGSKARAINLAHGLVRDLPHEFVAILDADISFAPDYYAQMLARFAADERLGLAGGILYDNCGGHFIRQRTNPEWSVSGPIQMFRRRCFEEMGGYHPLPRGGIDAVAESSARMLGWTVRAFPEIRADHHRRTGSEKGNIWATAYRDGVKEYGYGCAPAFVAAKAVYRLLEPPWVAGGVLRLLGYATAWAARHPRPLPPRVLESIRREQRVRLAALFRKEGDHGRSGA